MTYVLYTVYCMLLLHYITRKFSKSKLFNEIQETFKLIEKFC